MNGCKTNFCVAAVLIVTLIISAPAQTDLFSAVLTGDSVGITSLLGQGADVNATKAGVPLLVVAVRKGNLDIVKLLLSKGAKAETSAQFETELTQTEKTLDGKTQDRKVRYSAELTPLFIAAYMGQEEIARILLDNGAGVNTPSKVGGPSSYSEPKSKSITPLIAAAYGGHEKVAEILISKKANLNASCCDERVTAYSAAKSKGHQAFVGLLEKSGANASIRFDRVVAPTGGRLDGILASLNTSGEIVLLGEDIRLSLTILDVIAR
ncbi:MAG: ankyrin repeat domain-containing protein [Acidobacteria bacterium]|nr:ankyrin repeat domain-containing protein [Acidobacteriota bacterium]